MLKHVKLVLVLFSFIFVLFFLNINKVSASCVSNRVYTYEDKKITLILDLVDSGDDNTSAERIEENTGASGGGIFWGAGNSNSLAKEQLKLNEDGNGTLKFRASALTGHYVAGMYLKITVNGETITKINDGFDVFWCEKAGENDGHVDFTLTAKSQGFTNDDKIVFTLKAKTGMTSFCAALMGMNDRFLTPDYCRTNKDFSVDINIKAFEQAASGETIEDQSDAFNNNLTINTTTSESSNNSNYIPAKTNLNGIGIGDSQKIKCDDSLKSFISEIWKYFVIFGPILLIVMVSLDFFKALFSSDSDMLTKAGSNTVKRTISAIILLLLPLIIETILGFFGLELCI